jgi:hypothetical protein
MLTPSSVTGHTTDHRTTDTTVAPSRKHLRQTSSEPPPTTMTSRTVSRLKVDDEDDLTTTTRTLSTMTPKTTTQTTTYGHMATHNAEDDDAEDEFDASMTDSTSWNLDTLSLTADDDAIEHVPL